MTKGQQRDPLHFVIGRQTDDDFKVPGPFLLKSKVEPLFRFSI